MAGGKSTRLNPIVASHRLRAGATFSISLVAALSKGPVPVSSIVIASVATLLMLAGSALGVYLNRRVPNEHLNEATKDIVKLATGIIATIAGLVLSLLIATAKNSYDAVSTDVKSASADFIMMDRALAELGDKARAPREKLRQTIDIAVKTQLSLASNAVDVADPLGPLVRNHEAMQKDIRALVTTSSGEEWLQQRALTLSADLARARWMLLQEETDTLPGAFIAVVMLWLAIIFASFGLFTPVNPTAIGALVVGAVSISASLFLINELNTPFHGLVRITAEPLMRAMAIIGPLP